MSQKSVRIYVVLLLTFSVFASGCVKLKRVPNLEAIFATAKAQTGKRPVIIIPGILGSELVNPETDEIAWLNFNDAKNDSLRLPISPDLSKNKDSLVPRRIIEKAKVFSFLPEVTIYQTLIQTMQNYGNYKEGDWENPGAEGDRDTFYVFSYDWRLDNVENANKLAKDLEQLKQKLGKPALRFNVIAHSMGGLIVRYAAMYGERDLPNNGAQPKPDWSGAKHFNKIFMFGVPNEGSMEAFESLLKGYRVPIPTGKFKISSLSSEVAISSPAIFQLLPHQNTAKFYDEDLKPLEVDLYNSETWKRYSWSAVTDTQFRTNFVTPDPTLAGKFNEYGTTSLDDLDAYLEAVLNRARHFHQALDADTAVPASIAFFAFGSDCENTVDGAIIRRDEKTNRWVTEFNANSFRNSKGEKVNSKVIRNLLYAPGDGRVTRRSVLAETIAQQNYRNSLFRTAFPVSATFFCEGHSELPNSKVVQNNFLTALMMEVVQ
ncbi:MAG TPA: hypothetical protein VK892_08310 [Pyrinomonadaceae bacterium]|nr:hypothetical protein [Pyrinomonadaceae bacterium]